MGAIQTTLELIRQKLNESFRNADPREDDWVVLSNIVDHDGQPNDQAKDKIVMFLANIQHETTISTYNRSVPVKGDQYAIVAPPLYINLFVLFFANFQDKNYSEGLTMISRTISFFQQNAWFTRENLPSLDPVVEKLTLEITNLNPTELNYLMGLTGTKYLPSAYYKIRMIPFDSGAMQGQTPAAKGLQSPADLADTLSAPPHLAGAGTLSDERQKPRREERR
jgi:hypothetical protein